MSNLEGFFDFSDLIHHGFEERTKSFYTASKIFYKDKAYLKDDLIQTFGDRRNSFEYDRYIHHAFAMPQLNYGMPNEYKMDFAEYVKKTGIKAKMKHQEISLVDQDDLIGNIVSVTCYNPIPHIVSSRLLCDMHSKGIDTSTIFTIWDLDKLDPLMQCIEKIAYAKHLAQYHQKNFSVKKEQFQFGLLTHLKKDAFTFS